MYFNYPTERKFFYFAVVTLQTILRMTESKRIYEWIMWHIRDRNEIHAKFWYESLKVRNHPVGGNNVRINLKEDVCLWTGFI
jgi:hypothetical protein